MSAPKEKISVRWGIPALDDKGGLYVYGFMLRNYAKAKITRDEFLCILHLAAYHYESAGGESSPALGTVAALMGYAHENSVRNLTASLVEKGMLEIEHRVGETSVYNLHGFATAMLEWEATPTSQCSPTPTLGCTPTPTSQCETPLHPSVPEEEETKKKSKSKKKEEESAANAAIPQSPKSPKKKSDSHPNTQPIMAAFVECLPEALRGTFDYRANGKWAKVLAQIEVLKPVHIKTYYAQMRAQWNKSPKMHDQAITFYALYQYILAAAQNSTLAELEPPAAAYRPERLAEIAEQQAREDEERRARELEEAERMAAMTEEERLAEERTRQGEEFWQTVLGQLQMQMTRATFDTWVKHSSALMSDENTLTVLCENGYMQDWLSNRLNTTITRAVNQIAKRPLRVIYTVADSARVGGVV